MRDLPLAATPPLGFAVMLGPDGELPEALLIRLKAAGYTGIEPNCYHVRHLPRIAELCARVGLAIHAVPTGRWLPVAEAPRDYAGYTRQARAQLHQGAAIAAALDAPLIVGLIRGPGAIADVDAAAFLATIIPELLAIPRLQILLEPIAPGEAAWPHTLAQGAHLLDRLAQPRLKLLADSYHVAIAGEDRRLEHVRRFIGHLHLRDGQKQIPTGSAADYAPLLRLWREERLVLSFEPDTDLDRTVAHAEAGAAWIKASSR